MATEAAMEDINSDPDDMYSKVGTLSSVEQREGTQTVKAGDRDGESVSQIEPHNNMAADKEDHLHHEAVKDLIFSVEIEDTEASKRCNLGNAEYRLCVNASDISLQNQHIVLFSWPYKVVRRCGSGQDLFMMEVGRRASSGEGFFQFKTTTPDQLQTAVLTGIRRDSCRRTAPADVEELYSKVNKVNKPKHRQKEQ